MTQPAPLRKKYRPAREHAERLEAKAILKGYGSFISVICPRKGNAPSIEKVRKLVSDVKRVLKKEEAPCKE